MNRHYYYPGFFLVVILTCIFIAPGNTAAQQVDTGRITAEIEPAIRQMLLNNCI